VPQGLRFARTIWFLGILGLFSGCSEPKPVLFSHDSRLNGESFATRPAIRSYVIEATDKMFGTGPYSLRVPEEAGFADGGKGLGKLAPAEGASPPATTSTEVGDSTTGSGLYRKHCLHCHGVSGDGKGPTAPFLYPRPRDYRKGLFKFTSTGFGNKPSRADLRRTMLEGLEGTSMPSFSAMLSNQEMERVTDYVIFLSMRGEFEQKLVDEALNYEDADLEIFQEELPAEDLASLLFDRWSSAQAPEAATPITVARVPSTPESLERGRQLFLGLATESKLECAGCHGARGLGDGPSWIDPDTFNRYVFGGSIGPEPIAELERIATKTQKRWSDEWGDPLRPSNLNRGLYKGGRRPIDLYWRIANGISGTPMPAHASILTNPEDIWHVVNFILALPHDSTLLLPRPGESIPPPSPVALPSAAAALNQNQSQSMTVSTR
jgi:mono/diheme cytochrome c family protein